MPPIRSTVILALAAVAGPAILRAQQGGVAGRDVAEFRRYPAPVEMRKDMSAAEMARTLDGWLQEPVDRDLFAGVVLIARDGSPLVQRAYGLADRESGLPVATDMRFDLGSITTIFTKVAIGQLLATGKVAPTDTVGGLLPDYPDTPARRATVEQLLEHRGGIAAAFGAAFNAVPRDRFRANADYYRFVSAQPVDREARPEVCFGCYIVLGAIIERVSGMPYETYMAQRVFAPAGMKDTGWSETGASSSRTAIGYSHFYEAGRPNGPLHRAPSMQGASGHAGGGGYSTAADLLAFDTALRTGVLLDPARTSWILNGRSIGPGRARGFLGVGGATAGFNADFQSDGEWTIVVLANLDPPAASSLGEAARRALR